MEKYVCYSAEWVARGQNAASMSFYTKGSSRMLDFESEEQSSACVFCKLIFGYSPI